MWLLCSSSQQVFEHVSTVGAGWRLPRQRSHGNAGQSHSGFHVWFSALDAPGPSVLSSVRPCVSPGNLAVCHFSRPDVAVAHGQNKDDTRTLCSLFRFWRNRWRPGQAGRVREPGRAAPPLATQFAWKGVFVFVPLLKCMGMGFNFADALVTWWAGILRSVGMSIAMMVHFSFTAGHPLEKTGVRLMFHIGTCNSSRQSSASRCPYSRAVSRATHQAPRADPCHGERLRCVLPAR